MYGQGLRPKGYQPILDVLELKDLAPYMEGLRKTINACVASMPTHDEFIERNCKATPPA
jgi:tryptophan halogenase